MKKRDTIITSTKLTSSSVGAALCMDVNVRNGILKTVRKRLGEFIITVICKSFDARDQELTANEKQYSKSTVRKSPSLTQLVEN